MIAWLEELAGSELDRTEAEAQAAGGSSAHFAPGEGMPRETLVRMEQSAVLAQMRLADPSAIVSQLDPDAPTRWVLNHRAIRIHTKASAKQQKYAVAGPFTPDWPQLMCRPKCDGAKGQHGMPRLHVVLMSITHHCSESE